MKIQLMLLEILNLVVDHAENSLRRQQIDCFDLGIIDADSGLPCLLFFKTK